MDKRGKMSLEVTTFPHHRSLTLETKDLFSWIEELKKRDEYWMKWEGPGFFPHVILKTRYSQKIERFTGLVQFDIDAPSYLHHYANREKLLDALRNHGNCILAYPSFSDVGVWGVIHGQPMQNSEDYRTMATNVIDNLERKFRIKIDRRISLEPRAFRLIAPMKR